MNSSDYRGLVVGIGASAGGLQALEVFFRGLPSDTGMAFIVVTHLPKDYKSRLHMLLSRCTAMPVTMAIKGEAILPDHVYVCPANQTLTVKNGRLKLAPRGQDLRYFPIDQTLSSLATEYREYAIGILLSGGGSDGTSGLRAIKEHGGVTLAQALDGTDPAHKEMPGNAIAANVVDLVLPAEAMGRRLAEFARGAVKRPKVSPAEVPEAASSDAVKTQKQIAAILHDRLKHDFSGYKTAVFLRRVARRMQLLQIASLDSYIAYLRENTQEPPLLFRDLLIGVTSFFRDTAAFNALKSQVIPNLFQNAVQGEAVRIWVPACATGEEAYSLAILLREHMETMRAPPHVQIFATDIDETAIEFARSGRYHLSELQNVSTERLRRYFARDDLHCTISKDIRDMCVFSQHSVLENPPFSRLDLISCRNLLIYFGTQLQARVLPLFHFALKPGRYLFLGTSENVSQHPELFTAIDKKNRIYQRRNSALAAHRLLPQTRVSDFISTTVAGRTDVPMTLADLHAQVERRVMERFAPAHVVVNREGDILYYSARTGKYLEAAAGPPSRQLAAMARKELRHDLRAALREAKESGKRIERNGLSFEGEGSMWATDLVVEPFGNYENDPLFLVVFRDTGEAGAAKPPSSDSQSRKFDKALGHAEQELTETRRRLQLMVEEYETAVEELKSSNEELQSINEELQSANEEMETSKEELQSVNEELNTVNTELQNRVEELDRANSDLRNVFETTQVAIVFLDGKLAIRTFTPAATAIFKLIPGDRGRPLTDIASNLRDIGDLRRDIQAVFEQKKPIERQVHHVDGRSHYSMRILPYRNERGVIDGALIVFADASRLVEYETRQDILLKEGNACIRTFLDAARQLIREAPARGLTVEQFMKSFQGRLQALTAGYELSIRANWGSVALSLIVQSALEGYAGRNSKRLSITGPKLFLPPTQTLALVMVMHELADNAARHGSLSQRGGKIQVSWNVARVKGRDILRIDWLESAGPKVTRPQKTGLGRKLIDEAVKSELRGTIAIDYAPPGVKVQLSMPIKVREDARAGR